MTIPRSPSCLGARLEAWDPTRLTTGGRCWPMLLHIRFVAGGRCGCRPVSRVITVHVHARPTAIDV